MAKITYIENNGKSHSVEVAEGLTVINDNPDVLFFDPPWAVSYTHLTLPTICSV